MVGSEGVGVEVAEEGLVCFRCIGHVRRGKDGAVGTRRTHRSRQGEGGRSTVYIAEGIDAYRVHVGVSVREVVGEGWGGQR